MQFKYWAFEALAKIHGYYVSNCKEELKLAGENISENEILDTFLATQDDNEDDNEDDGDIETSSLEEENNDINANEGLSEPYILIIQNTMDLSHSNFQDLDDNDENRSEYLSDEENVLANDEYYEEEEEYNSNELASSFMTALHNS